MSSYVIQQILDVPCKEDKHLLERLEPSHELMLRRWFNSILEENL